MLGSCFSLLDYDRVLLFLNNLSFNVVLYGTLGIDMDFEWLHEASLGEKYEVVMQICHVIM